MRARPCALVVDGGAALQEDADNGLAVVPIRVRIGGEDFVDDGRVSRYPGFY
jgi:fatty acid-binding protein DegV